MASINFPTIVVEDICIWPKHIENDDGLKRKLLGLSENELIVLQIDRTKSVWRKMAQGKNPKPTEGLKPACDLCKEWWKNIFATRKGQKLSISAEV